MSTPAEHGLQQLEALYLRLDEALAGAPGNPCGRCRECCTGQGLSAHNVTVLEQDLIRSRVGGEKLEAFGRFLRRDGEVALCPYFDEQRWGCGIYHQRPYSCRVFGHHRSDDTALPQACVYRGAETVFAPARFFQAVPLAQELRVLSRAYWPYQSRHRLDEPSPSPTEPSARRLEAAGDALDLALLQISRGQPQQALYTFEGSDLPSTPLVLYGLSLAFEALARHQDALQALEVALEQAPECVPLWFRSGCNQFALGRWKDAETAFARTLSLEPKHPLAMGFLGGLALRRGDATEALKRLEPACRLAPENANFQAWKELADQARS